MRDALEVLLDTLLALKEEGVERVAVDDASLAALREVALKGADVPAPAPAPAPKAAPRRAAPVPEAAAPRPSFPARERVSAAPSAPVFEESPAPKPAAPAFPPPPKIAVPESGTKAEKLAAVAEQMRADAVCNKHLHRGKHLVFGVGDPDSPVFFCGEAPGAEEETRGEPFVGPAGQLLDKIIAATGLSRERVYIGNIMKWRPELPTLVGNRPPTPEEMAYCLPYVVAQIEIIRPRVIVALGLTAVNGLLGNDPDRKMGAIRGRRFDFHGVPVIPTYHPSYLLRNGTARSKRLVWEDFLAMMELLGMPISDRQRGYFLSKS